VNRFTNGRPKRNANVKRTFKGNPLSHLSFASVFFGDRLYKSSTVAEMGEHLDTIDMGRNLGVVRRF